MENTIITALAAAAIFKGKEIFQSFLGLVVRFTSVSFTVTNEDPSLYITANRWLESTGIIKTPRRTELVAGNGRGRPDVYNETPAIGPTPQERNNDGEVQFINSSDMFYGFYKKGFISVAFSSSRSQMNKEVIRSVTINFFLRGPSFLEKIKNEIFSFVDEEKKKEKQLTIKNNFLMRHGGDWELLKSPLKSIETIFLPNNLTQRIKDDIAKFVNSRAVYESFGKTYKHNYVIVGPPGTGKTSLAKAMASIYTGNMTIVPTQGDDGYFTSCMSNALRGVVLIEDIDCSQISVDRNDDESNHKGVSLSAVLNSLDGVNTKEGNITIVTTNKPENLDPAILRKGRTDNLIELGYLSEEELQECIKFFENFLKEKLPFSKEDFTWATYGKYQGYRPCDISERIFDYVKTKK